MRKASPPQGSPIRVLAVTANADDAASFQRIAQQEKWYFETCGSLIEAHSLLADDAKRVVFLDRDISNVGWRASLSNLLRHRHVRVILISPVVDDFLWDEVVECGGYDVVTRPLNPARAVSAVKLAVTALQTI